MKHDATVGMKGPKIQKTLTFNENVARLIQAYADRKGTNFQRVIQAAALHFFFSSTEGPDEQWMAALVQLEKGVGDPPFDLSGLPVAVHAEHAAMLGRKLVALQRRHAKTKAKSAEHGKYRSEAVRSFEKAINWANSEAGTWRTKIELSGGGLDGAIGCAIASSVEFSAYLHRMDAMLDAESDD